MFSASQECWNEQNQGAAFSQLEHNSHPGQLFTHLDSSGQRYPMPGQPVNLRFTPSQTMPAAKSTRHCLEGSFRGHSPYSTCDRPRARFGYHEGFCSQPEQFMQMEPQLYRAAAPLQSLAQPTYKRDESGFQPQLQFQQSGITAANFATQTSEPSSVFCSQRVTDPICGSLPQHGIDYNYATPSSFSHHLPSHRLGLFRSSQSSAQGLPFGPHTSLPLSACRPVCVPGPTLLPRSQIVYRTPASDNSGMISSGVRQGMFRSPSRTLTRSFSKLQNVSSCEETTLPLYSSASIPVPLPVHFHNSWQWQESSLSSSTTRTSAMCDNFNLDSLLNDSVGSARSFMQQLEDLGPGVSSTSLSRPDGAIFENQLIDITFPKEKHYVGKSLVGQNAVLDSERRVTSQSIASQSCFEQTLQARGNQEKCMVHFPQSGISSSSAPTKENTSGPWCPLQNSAYSSVRLQINAGGGAKTSDSAYPQKIHENFRHSLPISQVELQQACTQYPLISLPNLHFGQCQRAPSVVQPICKGVAQSLEPNGTSSCSCSPSSIQEPGHLCPQSMAYPLPRNLHILHSCQNTAQQQSSVPNSTAQDMTDMTQGNPDNPLDNFSPSLPAISVPQEPSPRGVECQTVTKQPSPEVDNGKIVSAEMTQKPLYKVLTPFLANISSDELNQAGTIVTDKCKSEAAPSVPMENGPTSMVSSDPKFSPDMVDRAWLSKPVQAAPNIVNAEDDIVVCNQASKNDLQIGSMTNKETKPPEATHAQIQLPLEGPMDHQVQPVASTSTVHSAKKSDHCSTPTLSVYKTLPPRDLKRNFPASSVVTESIDKRSSRASCEEFAIASQRQAGLDPLSKLHIPASAHILQVGPDSNMDSLRSQHSKSVSQSLVNPDDKTAAGTSRSQIAPCLPRQNMYSQYAEAHKNEACFVDASYSTQKDYSMSYRSQNGSHAAYPQHDFNAQKSCMLGPSETAQLRQMRSRANYHGRNIQIGWHVPARDGLHLSSEKHRIMDLESANFRGACGSSCKKGWAKRGGSVNAEERKESNTSSESTEHGTEYDGKPAPPTVVKKRKNPPVTMTLKKNKRKKTEDSEDFSSSLPLTEFNKLEKRRSGRNIKRKQYSENIDLQISDEISECEFERPVVVKEQHHDHLLLLSGQIIVEKILDMRIRNSKKNQADESAAVLTENQTEMESAQRVNEFSSSSNQCNSKTDEHLCVSGDEREEKNGKVSMPQLCSIKKDERTENISNQGIEEYFVKYRNFSYLHCEWKTKEELLDTRIDGKIRRYKSKLAAIPEYLKSDLSEPFNPDYVEVERILDVIQDEDRDHKDAKERTFLVKWCSLPYEESTWERESDIPKLKILEFERRCSYRPQSCTTANSTKGPFRKLMHQHGTFLNNNQLRDYQLEGVNWLLFNWYNDRNCILADEMGLGKTVQSIAFLQKVFDYGFEGPFLIVAPLSTICNWQREFTCWTKMNAVVYHGSQLSRDMIKTYEFFCRDDNLNEIPGKYKVNVVITTYEMIVLEISHLKDIKWKCSIIDEAHRLKNQSCKLAEFLRSMHLEFKVLLTGTPLQNNIEELFALLNFLQPETFNRIEALSAEFGDMKDNAQVEKLQGVLKPIMLRRLKEDVEKSLAPKEETIIEVELTAIQKKYYRAIMERNFEFLSKGAVSGNIPNLMNTMMELRKCCNHPFLIKGAEEKIHAEQSREPSLQLMVQCSGKLVLIDKLLPKLKSGGHKVLIFSQMVRCLDILEDYLVQSKYTYERIDGGIRGSERQAAIDRFSRQNSERFVFLLCTRAGGLGINLTAADTVIIFDSDWNPQNDLQAQARCHRIGQTKAVKIYRLITRNSYEREMFDKASLKLGLDRAVLQSISGRQDDSSIQSTLSKQEVETLLKLGAYGAIMDEDDDSQKFCEEDIDQILLRRTQTITVTPGQKGSTFSKASFVSGEEGSEISLNDPNFWEKWAKKADISVNLLKRNKLIIEEPRRRKQTRRFGGMTQDVEVLAEIGSESDSDYDEKSQTRVKKHRPKMKNWVKKDYFRVEKNLLAFGWGRWKRMLLSCGFSGHIRVEELESLCRAMLIHCLKFYNGDEKIKAFTWNLITPAHCSARRLILAAEGHVVSESATHMGRSSSNNEKVLCSNPTDDWIKEIDINSVLRDEGFRKHLQQHCNKILLRIRMLGFIKSEILGARDEDTNKIDFMSFELNFPKITQGNTFPGWDLECDKSLLFGIYKHGYGRYSFIRADPKLCFRRKYGMPKEKALADDADDIVEDDKEDPEYKPSRLYFSEFSEFEDSPGSNTAGTTPSPPANVDCGKELRKSSEGKVILKPYSQNVAFQVRCSGLSDADDKGCPEKSDAKLECGIVGEMKLAWPTPSELNMRVRRIVACYQKQHKQMKSRLRNVDQTFQKYKPRELLRERVPWTRREESDFYRTISTFGVECSEKGFSWTRFRQLAKLDKRSDNSLDIYYLAFKAMCEEVCGQKICTVEDISIVPVTKVTEERASRTLYRIELLNRIRLDVLTHQKLTERLEKCESSPDLPRWWKPGQHDKDLLLGMDRHGLTRTEVHILNDPSLSFSNSVLEYEQTLWKINLRNLVPRRIEENEKGDEKKNILSPKIDRFQKLQMGNDSLFANRISCAQKWPKDRILIQRAEHICYCVIHGKWPVFREQEESGYAKTQFAASGLSASMTNPPKSVATDGNDSKCCKTFSLPAVQSDIKDCAKMEVIKPAQDDMKMQGPSGEDGGSGEGTNVTIPSGALFHLCLSNSKLSESLQSLLKTSDATGFLLPEKQSWLRSKGEVLPSILSAAKSGKYPQSNPTGLQKKSVEKDVMKKKIRKSTGFVSPAVLPSDSRIPVCNPSEKKKFMGADAPLNKDLADWLKQNPGFIVDYKSLRQQINREMPVGKENYSLKQSPAVPGISKSAPDQFKAPEDQNSSQRRGRNSDKASDSRPNSLQEGPSEQDMLYLLNTYKMNSFNQSVALLNALCGTSSDMALITGNTTYNLPCFTGDFTKDSSNQTSQQEYSENRRRAIDAAGQQIHDMSVFGLDNMQSPSDIATLAAAMEGFPQLVMNDLQNRLKHLLVHPLTPFDRKSLSGLAIPFYSGLSREIYPLMCGLYDNTEIPAVPDFLHLAQANTFLESEYAKHKENNNLNALQNLLAAQSSLMMNVGFDIGNCDIQKLFQTREALQQPLASLGISSSGSQKLDFDDSLHALYEQLHASSTQKDPPSKKGRNDPTDRKPSPANSPFDLRRKSATSETSEKS